MRTSASAARIARCPSSSTPVTVTRLLLRHEAHEEEGEDGEEDDRLADGHDDACDLLVCERGQSPKPRRFDVEVIDRLREKREQKPYRACQHERGEEVNGFRAG